MESVRSRWQEFPKVISLPDRTVVLVRSRDEETKARSLPSAEDLDAVAEEQKIRDATS